MKAKKDKAVKDKTRSVGGHGHFTPGHPSGNKVVPASTGPQGESKKHPGSPKHGGQLFHGSS